MSAALNQRFHTFAEFYPAFLSDHSSRESRELRFIGSTLALLLLAVMFVTGQLVWIVPALLAEIAFAWIGHHRYEKNQPTLFHQPIYAFIANWVLYWQMLTGQVSF